VKIENFIGKSQLSAMRSACNGEEGEFFKGKIAEVSGRIAVMPKSYETDGQGDSAKVQLHYFARGCDWFITERDQEEEQLQAYGFACLNGDLMNAESGYISIVELLENGAELDLYYTQETIGEVKKRLAGGSSTENKTEKAVVK
jgi:hypothetical protein